MSSNNCYIIKAVLRATAILLLLEINNITICAYHVDTHNVAKRMMDSDLCLGRFDVHMDTIIRTKESLKLKAVFLDETEVLNNQECANLCCDTENCDVFIFEEKVKGTCFLFQCGPPEDFRCKFTRHANYTSAVMSPMRQSEQQTPPPLAHSAIPQVPSTSLSQHEMELVSLKGGGKGLRNDELPPGNSSQGAKNPATAVEATTTKSGGCSRFQFACHSGECLAVYNACDGIPQCEDGSDEGPECPKQTSAGAQQNSPNGQQMQDLSNTVRLLPSDSGNAGNNAPQMTMQRQYQIHNREDPMTAPKQWPQINPMFLDGDSRIFNHKGGLQIPASSMSGSGYQMVPQQDAFMRPQMSDVYARGQMQQQQQQSWLPEHYQSKIPGNSMDWNQQAIDQSAMGQQSPAVLAPQIPQLPQPPQLTATQVELQQQRPDWPIVPLMPVQSSKNHPDESAKKPLKADGGAKVAESGEIFGNEYQDESDDEAEMRITTAAPRKKNRKHKKPKEGSKDKTSKAKDAEKPLHEQLKMIHNDLEMEFVDHDGEAERPGGAVLSLTLGIIIMAALAVLVGCRMRVVGRRMRRGGKSQYAHDADFLVNGMYL